MSYVGKKPFIISNIFYYIEYNYLCMFGSNKVFKLSVFSYFRPVIKLSGLYLLNSSFFSMTELKCFWGLSRSILYYLISSLFFFYKVKLQLVGLGYRFFIKQNFLVLKIGSSHLYKVKVPLTVKIKKKKLNMILYSYDFFQLRQFSFFIKSLKLPGVYHGKGIKFKYEKLLKKEGKKNQL